MSVGFVVCGKNFEEVTRFHSYIYAEDKLHDRFQEMTRIERKDLLSAPDKYVIQRDLLVMCTGEAMAFPTLEEYIQKENVKTGIRNPRRVRSPRAATCARRRSFRCAESR